MEKKIRVLLSQPSLENHSRGIITVANMLRNAGMEVIYISNSLPDQVARTAIQEDVDAIGISILCGAELIFGKDLVDKAKEFNMREDVIFMMGGIFPPQHIPKLKEIGFSGIFGPSATKEEIVGFITQNVSVN
ncbi:MAG: cobalamin B12-binding domain-containing protein [Deltaproteobacteria bacterium]|nr:cobalamin B12-binding domain-containing protein [Deltaproteobacteria bacterium]